MICQVVLCEIGKGEDGDVDLGIGVDQCVQILSCGLGQFGGDGDDDYQCGDFG